MSKNMDSRELEKELKEMKKYPEEDKEIAEALKKAGEIIGIDVLDNLIITKDGIAPVL